MNKGYNFSFPSPKNCGSFLKKMSLGGAWVGARPAQAVSSEARTQEARHSAVLIVFSLA